MGKHKNVAYHTRHTSIQSARSCKHVQMAASHHGVRLEILASIVASGLSILAALMSMGILLWLPLHICFDLTYMRWTAWTIVVVDSLWPLKWQVWSSDGTVFWLWSPDNICWMRCMHGVWRICWMKCSMYGLWMLIGFVEFLGTSGEFLWTNTKSTWDVGNVSCVSGFFYLYMYYSDRILDGVFSDARNFHLTQDELSESHMLVVELNLLLEWDWFAWTGTGLYGCFIFV